jgi:hypothetical protein
MKKQFTIQLAALRRVLVLFITAMLLPGSAYCLQINGTDDYTIAPFGYWYSEGALWDDANWDTYFGITSGTANNSDFTWDTDNDILTVHDRLDLHWPVTITGITVVMDDVYYDIVIYSNYKLKVIDGAKITSSTNSYWAGITIAGSNEVQFAHTEDIENAPPYYAPFDANTTLAYDNASLTLNNATIENAIAGVRSELGGMLFCESSHFKNCQIGIEIKSFTNFDFYNFGWDKKNASYISNTEFIVDGLIASNTDYSNYKMIYLHENYGIHIQGCTFRNDDNTQFSTCFSRGTGIKSENSTFSVHPSGTPNIDDPTGSQCVTYSGGQSNTFYKLSYGIYSEENATTHPYKPSATISSASFYSVENAVKAIDNERLAIRDCLFDMIDVDDFTDDGLSCNYKALYLNVIREFVIEHNIFLGDPITHLNYPGDLDFIHVDNCWKKDNKIYRNSFTVNSPAPNLSITGIRLSGENSKIQIICNSFSNVNKGITIESGSIINPVWDNKIEPGKTLSNHFTSSVLRTDLNNLSSTTINYYELNTYYTASITKTVGNWTNTNITAEASCSQLLCTSWPVGVGIKEVSTANINVYPNPATNYLNVDFKQNFIGTLSLLDLLGRTVAAVAVADEITGHLDLNNVADGLYVLHVQERGGEISTYKICVKNQ